MSELRGTVLALLCLQISITLPNVQASGKKWTYGFSTNSTFGNFHQSNGLSQWGLSGKLVISSFENYKIMKLEDLKTSAFNGPNTEEVSPPKEQPVQEEVQHLLEPFLIRYDQEYNQIESIEFGPGNPVWSMNIKRGLASMFQLHFSKTSALKNERNIFGSCRINLGFTKANGKITIIKGYDHKECEHGAMTSIEGTYFGKTTKKYTFIGEEDITHYSGPPDIIDVESDYSYHREIFKPKDDKLEMQQRTVLELLTAGDEDTTFDTSKYTVKTTLTYEEEEEDVKRSEENIREKLLSKMINFVKYMNQNYSLPLGKSDPNLIDDMFNTLSSMSYTLDAFQPSAYLYEDNDSSSRHPFVSTSPIKIYESMLPYVGTEDSVRVLKNIATRNLPIKKNGLMALLTFPFHVKSTTKQMVEDMEELLKLNHTTNTFVEEISILSFANLVRNLYNKVDLSNNRCPYKILIEKYENIYCELARSTAVYKKKLNYIAGLGNMYNFSENCLMSIVINPREPEYIRTSAMYALKTGLTLSEFGAFEYTWPVIKNSEEPFKLRAAALDVLLDSEIDKSQINAMVQYMKQASNDPVENQLYNYFYTRSKAGKGSKFDATVDPDLEPVASQKNLQTGFYFIKTMDIVGNTHSMLEIRTVADPITNIIKMLHLTYGEYSGYIRFEGYEFRHSNFYWNREIIRRELLKQFHLMKRNPEENMFLDIIIYYKGRPVFATHEKGNPPEDESVAHLFLEPFDILLLKGLYRKAGNDFFTRSVYKKKIPSEVGTPVSLSTKEYAYANVNFAEEDYSSRMARAKTLWQRTLSVESYNPVLNMRHGITEKDIGEFYIHMIYKLNQWDISLLWPNQQQFFDSVNDHIYVLHTDNDERIKEHCSQCQSQFEVSTSPSKYCHFKDRLASILKSNLETTFVVNSAFPSMQPLITAEHVVKSAINYPVEGSCSRSTNLTTIIHEHQYLSKFQLQDSGKSKHELKGQPVSITCSLYTMNNTLEDTFYFNFTRLEEQNNTFNVHLYNNNITNYAVDIAAEIKFDPSKAENIEMIHLGYTTPTSISFTYYCNSSDPVYEEAFNINAVLSVSKERQREIEEGINFKTCHEEKTALSLPEKVTPPTIACYRTSQMMSSYNDIFVKFEFDKSPRLQQCFATYAKEVLRKDKLEHNNISFSYSAINPETLRVVVDSEEKNVPVPQAMQSKFNIKPINKVIKHGYENMCYITADTVKTFTEQTVKTDGVSTMLAFIDCKDERTALLTGRDNSSMVFFKMWTDDVTVETEVDSTSYKIKFNIEQFTIYETKNKYEFVQSEDSPVTIIKTNIIEVLYDGYTVAVKQNIKNNKEVCGICANGVITGPNEQSAKYLQEKLQNPAFVLTKVLSGSNELL